MLSCKEKRTLICYAGSASEASIGSKPVGSELSSYTYSKNRFCQYFYTQTAYILCWLGTFRGRCIPLHIPNFLIITEAYNR